MKRTWSYNPFSFTPLPVTIITALTYSALIVALLVIHLVVPSAPENISSLHGINLTDAWHDLQTLSNGFHPYNSRRNDDVRNWLLLRLDEILHTNGVAYQALGLDDVHVHTLSSTSNATSVVVFNDLVSNLTFAGEASGAHGLSVYFEGTNIIVYIRGTKDDPREWWRSTSTPEGLGGVLVNAHYDSVSTGYGSTDDGIGVVSILQLVKYFTRSGNQPKRGILALLNNGEEDFLNGAKVFSQHVTARFPHTFLNLEGAGAGGRATLFRSTDTEVTRLYGRSAHPFGTVISGDGFKRGLVRSQTDYVVFANDLGMRGLDVAFMEPRSRYHTEQDDARHTSIDSLWHMLSAALSTMQGLTSDTSTQFDGKNPEKGKVSSGKGTYAVWFDLFGRVFAVFELQTLFALSVTLLVVAPVTLIVLGTILFKFDKLYLFSSSKHHHHAEGDDSVPLQGWRGAFRFPIIFVAASAGTVGLAFLLAKINPYIIYSSPYSVWSMMLSIWLFVAWFLSKFADYIRPTAFQRAYTLLWMFVAMWLVLVFVTALEERFKLAAGYFVVFYFTAIFLATSITLLELFGLPYKCDYADSHEADQGGPTAARASSRPGSVLSSRINAADPDEVIEDADQEDNNMERPSESTSLLRKGKRASFAKYNHSSAVEDSNGDESMDETKISRVYGTEQGWSWSLPAWTWLFQFLILAPTALIFVGQIGLLLTSGTYQTLSDGNSALLVYILIAISSILIMAPLAPFLHRYTYHIPAFLLCVFTGTAIYNLVAFPFSETNRLKLYFVQKVDLDSGLNKVILTGLGHPYIDEVTRSLPSAAGKPVECIDSPRLGLVECSWDGLDPRVVSNTHPEVPPRLGYSDWLAFNVTRVIGKNEAHFRLFGRNTRACRISLNRPISAFHVEGSDRDSRFPSVTEAGSKEIRLWSRTWEKPWAVHLKWDLGEGENPGNEGLDGRVICLWNDESKMGVIPALDEVRLFAPTWVAISKLSDGLVEGSKSFMV